MHHGHTQGRAGTSGMHTPQAPCGAFSSLVLGFSLLELFNDVDLGSTMFSFFLHCWGSNQYSVSHACRPSFEGVKAAGVLFSLCVRVTRSHQIQHLPPTRQPQQHSPTTWFPYRSCSRIEVLPTDAWPHTTTLQLFPMLSVQPSRTEGVW